MRKLFTMVPQPRFVDDAQKVNICLLCGNKGDPKHLVYCIQCKSCAEHSYCQEKIHRDDNGKIIWRCEDCAPSNPKCKTELLRKSERLSYATDAKNKRMIMKKKSDVVRKQPLVKSNEGESAGCLAKTDAEKILPILENENVFCKQPESPKDPSNMSSDKQAMECEIYPEFDKNCGAQPLSDPVLTGQFRLNNVIEKSDVVRKQPIVGSNESESVGCLAKNDTEKILPILENENVFCKQPESPKDPSNMSSDKQAMECETYAESEVVRPLLLQYPEFDKNSGAQPLSDPVLTGKFGLNDVIEKSDVVRKQPLVMSSESVGCLAKNDTENILPILENENVFCKQPESPKDSSNMSSDKQAMECEIYAESDVIMPPLLQYPEFDKNSRAQPLSDPVWTGQFRLDNATDFHLTAYISSKAYPKVNWAVTVLPKLLDVEMLPKRIIWPKSFAAYPPNSDCIGLYFFPQYERDEMIFDHVLKDAIDQDNALKAVINNLELLIFSSHLLPPDDRRICTKYYLWGVFKPKPRK